MGTVRTEWQELCRQPGVTRWQELQRMPLLYCWNSIPVLEIKTLTTMAMMDFRPMWIDYKLWHYIIQKMLRGDDKTHQQNSPYFLLKGLATSLFKDSVSPNCLDPYSPTLPFCTATVSTRNWRTGGQSPYLTAVYSHGRSLQPLYLPNLSSISFRKGFKMVDKRQSQPGIYVGAYL